MNEEMKDFFQQKANYAIVVNCKLGSIEKLKHFLLNEDIQVIYQKTSLRKLRVTEDLNE